MNWFASLPPALRRIGRGRARTFAPAVAYAATLLTATELSAHLPPARRDAWLAWASTDLTNLSTHPLGCLVTSAFLTTDYVALWAGLSVLGLACTAARLGGVRTVVVAGSVHVLATLASQAVVAVRIRTGDLTGDARTMLDIGPSYVVVAALVAGVGFGRPRTARLACAATLVVLVPALLDGIAVLDVSALGHVAAMALALATGALLLRWWPPRRITR